MEKKCLFNKFKFILLKIAKMLPVIFSDKFFIKLDYNCMTGKKLDFNNLITYNEKVQYLKLYDRKKIYTKMVDKYEAKLYVSNIIGNEYVIPLLGVYNTFDDIDFSKLPNQFVIKCTHDSGGLVVCKDINTFDYNSAKNIINEHLKKNYYNEHREWPYKNIKKKIIVEKYMSDNDKKSLIDYKFFCFNGEPKFLYISDNSHTKEQSIAFFDMDFNLLEYERTDYKKMDYIPYKPKTFEIMKQLSKQLSKGIPHLRVDWYEIDGHLYFGELTFSTCAGFIPFKKDEWDYELGQFLDISSVKKGVKYL